MNYTEDLIHKNRRKNKELPNNKLEGILSLYRPALFIQIHTARDHSLQCDMYKVKKQWRQPGERGDAHPNKDLKNCDKAA